MTGDAYRGGRPASEMSPPQQRPAAVLGECCEYVDELLRAAIRHTEQRRAAGLPFTLDRIDQAKARRQAHRDRAHPIPD